MNRPILLGYQLLIGISDAATGILLVVTPAFTASLMHLHVPVDALPYFSFVGAFVLSVGLACLYGAYLTYRGGCRSRLEVVWLLTAITRASVAVFLVAQIMSQTLETGWLTVAIFDGACVLIQAIGLRKGWLADAAG